MNKFENHTCEHCGTILSKDCKVLLDSNTCPHCEEGRASIGAPACDHSGYKVGLTMMSWG
jgi:hypothetical protein